MNGLWVVGRKIRMNSATSDHRAFHGCNSVQVVGVECNWRTIDQSECSPCGLVESCKNPLMQICQVEIGLGSRPSSPANATPRRLVVDHIRHCETILH